MLYCAILWCGYCGRISHLSDAYFEVFSSSFCFLFAIHGHLISNSGTFFYLCTTLASIRFALASVFSAYTGTSQKALARSFLYSGFGVSGEHQDGALSINPISQSTSKKRTLRAASCLVLYSLCARTLHPLKTWGTLSIAFPHIRHLTSVLSLVFVLYCW